MKDLWKHDLCAAYLETVSPIDFFIFAAIYGLINAVYFERPVSAIELLATMIISVLGQVFVEYKRRQVRRTILWLDLDDFIKAHRAPAEATERPRCLRSRE